MNEPTPVLNAGNPHASPPNRWIIALAGTGLQLALGTVYAWSYFVKPLIDAYGWTKQDVTWTFSLAILMLGVSAAVGGLLIGKLGPRKLAMLGGTLFGAGYFIGASGLHLHSLALLYLGYGIVGGTGLGLGYVTPVATVAKWFPDKKGLVTGMVVMGFGFGALLMSKVLAPTLMAWKGGDLVYVFAILGGLFLAWTLPMAALLRNPPAGYAPKGWTPPAPAAGAAAASQGASAGQAIFSPRFLMMWVVFFCNIVAGVAVISFQAPLMMDLWAKAYPPLAGADAKVVAAALQAAGATLIACSSLLNGFGRIFWGAASDRIGRSNSFRMMLLSQVAVFVAMIYTGNPWLFGAMVCYVLLCYGGGFGTMPSFILDVFGPRRMAAVYGAILTAWAAAGVVGPSLFAYVSDSFANPANLENATIWRSLFALAHDWFGVKDFQKAASTWSFLIAAGFLAIGTALSLFLSNHAVGAKPAPQRAS
jgi:OFA family oxalate/formate antiporter-like MFS transporter